MSAAPPVLECRGLEKSYGNLRAVEDLSLSIEAGTTYGLLGPNGAGKTTAISMICGLLEPDAGEVLVTGTPVTTRSVAGRAAIGYVPQELAFYPDLTASENLRLFGRLYGMGGERLTRRIEEVLELVGLTERAADRADEYSGGMKRRLNIGLGLLHEPRLLVLDEPTVGVDPQSRHAILESIGGLAGDGTAVLYTTHYMEEAERICDRIGIIDHGRLEAEGTREELLALVGERTQLTLVATGDMDAAARAALTVSGVREAHPHEHGLDLIADDAAVTLPNVLQRIASTDVSVSSLNVEEPDLEAVFLHLTGRALRD